MKNLQLFSLKFFQKILTIFSSKMNLTTIDIKESGEDWAKVGSFIIDRYLSRITGGLGVLLNFLFAIMLLHKDLKHKIYDFYWCRCICNLMVSLLVTGYVTNCFSCSYESYWSAIYGWYILTMNLRVFSLSSFISDIFLVLNRFCEITKKDFFLAKMTKKLNLLICFLFPLTLSVPSYLAFTLVKTENMFYMGLTEFGNSRWFTVYYLGLFLLETIVPLSVQFILYFVSVYKFKRVMYIHGHLTKNQTAARKAEVRFTKSTFLLGSICMVGRVFDLTSTVFTRLVLLYPTLFSRKIVSIISFFKSITNFILYFVHAFDSIVYIKMDRNLWKLILKTFKISKVKS